MNNDQIFAPSAKRLAVAIVAGFIGAAVVGAIGGDTAVRIIIGIVVGMICWGALIATASRGRAKSPGSG